MVNDYIKQILIIENPIKTLLLEHRGNASYLDTVFDPISDQVAALIVEDGMRPCDALKSVLIYEFGPDNIVPSRFQNCVHRLSMLRKEMQEDPKRELSR